VADDAGEWQQLVHETAPTGDAGGANEHDIAGEQLELAGHCERRGILRFELVDNRWPLFQRIDLSAADHVYRVAVGRGLIQPTRATKGLAEADASCPEALRARLVHLADDEDLLVVQERDIDLVIGPQEDGSSLEPGHVKRVGHPITRKPNAGKIRLGGIESGVADRILKSERDHRDRHGTGLLGSAGYPDALARIVQGRNIDLGLLDDGRELTRELVAELRGREAGYLQLANVGIEQGSISLDEAARERALLLRPGGHSQLRVLPHRDVEDITHADTIWLGLIVQQFTRNALVVRACGLLLRDQAGSDGDQI